MQVTKCSFLSSDWLQVVHQARAYPVFHSMRCVRVQLHVLPLDVHHRPTPSLPKPTCTAECRDTVRVKCFPRKHNTMSPPRARTENTQSQYRALPMSCHIYCLTMSCIFTMHNISKTIISLKLKICTSFLIDTFFRKRLIKSKVTSVLQFSGVRRFCWLLGS